MQHRVPERMVVVFLLALFVRSADAQLRPAPGDLLWSQEIGGPLWAPITHHDGMLYFGSDDGTFRAFDIEAREVAWSFRTSGRIRSGATVIQDHVVFASDDGFLYALELDTGTKYWSFPLGSAGLERVLPAPTPPYSYDYKHSSPMYHAGIIYVGSADGTLYAVHYDIGLELWHLDTEGPVRSTAVSDGESVYFGSWDGYLYAAGLRDGILKWRTDTGGVIQSSPAVAPGTVFVGSRSARVLAFDAATGAERWQHVHQDGSWVESSPVHDDGVLYVGSSDARRLFALDAASGETIWEVGTGGWSWGDPVLADGKVYIGAIGAAPYPQELEPGFHCVDAESGELRWSFTPEPVAGDGFVTGGVYATPAIVQGVIYVGGVDGRLYALKQ